MAKLNWTSEAERWLKDIYDYIAADNPSAAARVVDGSYERAQLLARFPAAGYLYENPAEEVRY
jgi:toxin ParE1/3/4